MIKEQKEIFPNEEIDGHNTRTKKIELNKLTTKLSQVENLANLIEDSSI